MAGVPNIFANATGSIPLSQLDANFATVAILGNASIGLGNTTTTVGNLTLANATSNGGNILVTAGGSNLTGGFSQTPSNLATISNITPNPASGNYQFGTNNGAFTLTKPTSDCAIDMLITNGASAGTITFSGFTVGTTGDTYNTTNGNKFILSIRVINGVGSYIWKALQ